MLYARTAKKKKSRESPFRVITPRRNWPISREMARIRRVESSRLGLSFSPLKGDSNYSAIFSTFVARIALSRDPTRGAITRNEMPLPRVQRSIHVNPQLQFHGILMHYSNAVLRNISSVDFSRCIVQYLKKITNLIS